MKTITCNPRMARENPCHFGGGLQRLGRFHPLHILPGPGVDLENIALVQE